MRSTIALLSAAALLGGTATGCARVEETDAGGGTEICTNGVDDDGDNLVDCFDANCATHPVCAATENCTNGVDDDGDALVDCFDPGCAGNPACGSTEICTNGVDDDGDLAVDCADTDCTGHPQCGEDEDCDDGVDNDGDTWADCDDPDCTFDPACNPSAENCSNGIDDDGDGHTDCQDSDCTASPACQPGIENCSNGIDDDGDGAADCLDSDCAANPACSSWTAISSDPSGDNGACLADISAHAFHFDTRLNFKLSTHTTFAADSVLADYYLFDAYYGTGYCLTWNFGTVELWLADGYDWYQETTPASLDIVPQGSPATGFVFSVSEADLDSYYLDLSYGDALVGAAVAASGSSAYDDYIPDGFGIYGTLDYLDYITF